MQIGNENLRQNRDRFLVGGNNNSQLNSASNLANNFANPACSTSVPTSGCPSGGPSFKGPIDGIITQSLMTIDSNPMANAALVDIFSMVLPRTYVDTEKRNKYAGAETFIREISSTIVVCLSSGVLAKGISYLYNKMVNPEVNVNHNSWVSNDSLDLLKCSWQKGKNPQKYVENIFNSLSAVEGNHTNIWKNIKENDDNLYDENKWKKFTWKDAKFKNIQDVLKTKTGIEQTLGQIIREDVDKKDAKQVLEIIEHRVVNVLGAANLVKVELGDKKLETSVHNLLRDTYDMGKNVFANNTGNIDAVITKLTKMNKIKTIGALSIASTLGLITQYVNRQITKKRTGTDAFVGDVDYNKSK